MSVFSDTLMTWPARAVVSAGMPYGNKELHFGHVGGVFVPADAYARFLRDRIGAANVRFVCGTDCFGSPINEGYRKAVDAGVFKGTIQEYVEHNHEKQKRTLDAYDISLSIYEGSGIGRCAAVHQQATYEIITRLYEQGWLKLEETMQFYDAQAQTFLNGRQVSGYCPVAGCKSKIAYADECEMGHQFSPEDLINPISSLTGTKPKMRPVKNWYFDLPAFTEYLREYTADLKEDGRVRSVVSKTISEFLGAPVIFIKNELRDEYEKIADNLPKHVFREAQKGKQSFSIEFESVALRDKARPTLEGAHIRYRTGKAVVPFRITGNIEWGVKSPVINDAENLCVWCWPESLWAPISFTQAYNDTIGLQDESWKDFWCSDDSQVYQFIGQDNIYFYGVAQPALFHALQVEAADAPGEYDAHDAQGEYVGDRFAGDAWPLRQTKLIANHHLLFGRVKASSSGDIKPPSADELLEHYTSDQLRAHWLALGLDQKSVSFSPKPFNPDVDVRTDPRVVDPVLKEAALLNNVFNRLARSCFYETHKSFDDYMPLLAPSEDVIESAHNCMREYERHMSGVRLHEALTLCDSYIRSANKRWADDISAVEHGESDKTRAEVLANAFFELRISTLLMHPMTPRGCELICKRLGFEPVQFFSWDWSFNDFSELCEPEDVESGWRALEPLEPKFDFFPKHESQIKKKKKK